MPQNSAFADIILQIQARIKTVVGDDVIRMVDEDKGQLESYDQRTGKPAVSFPCLLINFEDFDFNDIGNNAQVVTGKVVLRLGFPPFSSAASWMPLTVKQKALKYFDYEWLIYKALHGWKMDNIGYINCRNAVTERREDPIRVRALSYEIEFEEYSASTDYNRISKPPDEYETEL